MMRGIMMKNKDELLEQMIKDEYERAALEEDAALREDDSISVPAGVKESLFLKISKNIEMLEQKEKLEKPEDVDRIKKVDEIERVKGTGEEKRVEKKEEKEEIEGKQPDNLYANMSEEDRRALEIGRRVMEEEARAKREGKVVRKKKRVKMYFGVAAALVLAMAWGVTTLGGPEKIMRMMTQVVGSRQIERVDSSEDNLIIVNEDEEEAYQKIEEEFGVEPVKVMLISEDMEFVNMKLDEVMQTAELYYKLNGNKLSYLISASHKKAAFGFEIADEVIDEYSIIVHGKKIEVKKYQVAGEDVVKYSASFKDLGLKYVIYGIMEQPEFELLIERLHFFS